MTARGLAGAGGPPDRLRVLAADERHLLLEQRVLSRATSGGGFLVPADLADRVISAARAAGALSRVAAEFVTEAGETFAVPLAGTYGTAAWVAESGSYTPSDETITQAAMGAHKGSTKLIASEELLADESVGLDDYLAGELGGRLGVLQENAFALGDGSGKPMGCSSTRRACSAGRSSSARICPPRPRTRRASPSATGRPPTGSGVCGRSACRSNWSSTQTKVKSGSRRSQGLTGSRCSPTPPEFSPTQQPEDRDGRVKLPSGLTSGRTGSAASSGDPVRGNRGRDATSSRVLPSLHLWPAA